MHLCDAAVVFQAGDSGLQHSPRYGHLLLDPGYVDYQLIMKRIQLCEEIHSKYCVIDQSKNLSLLKVVDCENRQIVKALLYCSYIALSYVRGTLHVPNAMCSIQTQDGNSRLPTLAPDVFEDAISASQMLIYCYSWVKKILY